MYMQSPTWSRHDFRQQLNAKCSKHNNNNKKTGTRNSNFQFDCAQAFQLNNGF